MTPDDLRSLVQEASIGPWQVDERFAQRDKRGEGSKYIRVWLDHQDSFTTMVHSPANARLIALAPQLALLVAEMGEALVDWRDAEQGFAIGSHDYPQRIEQALARLRAALVSLEALEKPQ